MARMRVLRVRRRPHTVFFTYRKLRKNRPREQDFDVWRTSAEVKAGSARFFMEKCAANAHVCSIEILNL